MPSFVTQSENASTPAASFDYVTTLSNWSMFAGRWPMPGIVSATAPQPLALGVRVRVENTDGSVHHERVTAFEYGRRYAIRMELSPPASWLMQHIDEELVFEAAGEGTRVIRRFETVPRSALTAPFVALITPFLLRPAVEAHDRVVARALGYSSVPRNSTDATPK